MRRPTSPLDLTSHSPQPSQSAAKVHIRIVTRNRSDGHSFDSLVELSDPSSQLSSSDDCHCPSQVPLIPHPIASLTHSTTPSPHHLIRPPPPFIPLLPVSPMFVTRSGIGVLSLLALLILTAVVLRVFHSNDSADVTSSTYSSSSLLLPLSLSAVSSFLPPSVSLLSPPIRSSSPTSSMATMALPPLPLIGMWRRAVVFTTGSCSVTLSPHAMPTLTTAVC